MDKNTIWAIVLSTLVIVGSYFLLPLVFGNKNAPAENQSTVEVSSENQTVTSQNNAEVTQEEILTDSLFIEDVENEEDSVVPAIEQKITIDTGVAKIVFTTKVLPSS